MPAYPGADTERRIRHEDLLGVVTAIFAACGMAPADAALLARTLAEADLRGVHSHGCLRVGDYAAKLTTGGVDPRGRPRIVHEAGAALVIDGGNAMGQIGGDFAMRAAIERARRHQLCFAAVRGSNHCGALATFAMIALPEDMIGICATNALPTMAPWGGAEKIIGINPLAVAIPAGEETPIVLDAAFSGSSHGKIRVFHQKGYAIPDGWAFDEQGLPTIDAAEAIKGLLQPIGGHKGTGLGMVFGILSSLLSGAAYGTELGNMVDGPRAGQDGHFFLALNIAGFTDPAVFKARVDAIVREVHASRRAPGVDRLLVPGELEAETERAYRAEGIPLNDETLATIAATARAHGVDPGPLLAAA